MRRLLRKGKGSPERKALSLNESKSLPNVVQLKEKTSSFKKMRDNIAQKKAEVAELKSLVAGKRYTHARGSMSVGQYKRFPLGETTKPLSKIDAKHLGPVYAFKPHEMQICWDFLNGIDCRYDCCPSDRVIVKSVNKNSGDFVGQEGYLAEPVRELDSHTQYRVFGLKQSELAVESPKKGKKMKNKKSTPMKSKDISSTGEQFRGKKLKLGTIMVL